MSLVPTEEELPQEPERATLQIRNKTFFYPSFNYYYCDKEQRLVKSYLRDQFLIPMWDPTKREALMKVLIL